jgi:hypothetical protein
MEMQAFCDQTLCLSANIFSSVMLSKNRAAESLETLNTPRAVKQNYTQEKHASSATPLQQPKIYF